MHQREAIAKHNSVKMKIASAQQRHGKVHGTLPWALQLVHMQSKHLETC